MTPHELVSAASYTVVTPVLLYFAFVHWNKNEKRAAWVLGCLSLFFLLMAVGLVMLRYVAPAPILTAAKSLLILAIALMGAYAAFDFFRTRRKSEVKMESLHQFVREIEGARHEEQTDAHRRMI